MPLQLAQREHQNAILIDDLKTHKQLVGELLKKTDDQQRQSEKMNNDLRDFRQLLNRSQLYNEKTMMLEEALHKTEQFLAHERRLLHASEGAVTQFQEQNSQLQHAAERFQIEMLRLEEVVGRQKQEMEKSGVALEALGTDKQVLLVEHEAQHKSVEQKEMQSHELKFHSAQVEQQLASLHVELQKQEELAESLKIQNLSLEQSVRDLTSYVDELATSCAAKQRSADSMIASSEGMRERLLGENGELVSKVSSLEDEIRKAREAKDSEISQLLDRQQQLEKLSAGQAKEIEMRDGAIGDLEQQSAVLQQELCDKNEECSRLAALTDDLKAQQQRVDHLLESKSQEHEATLQEFKMLLTQTQLYEEKTMMLEEALQKAELNLATERGLLRSSEENVIQLAKLNSQSQHAAEHLQVHMLQLEEVVGRQKQEMERACITLEALGTVKQELLMEHKAQHKSVEQKEMQSHGLLAKNGELVAKVSSLEDEIRKVREAKDSEISQLLDRQQQLEKLSAGQAKEIEMRDGAIGDLEQQSAVLQQELCDKNEECSRLAALTDDLKAQQQRVDHLLESKSQEHEATLQEFKMLLTQTQLYEERTMMLEEALQKAELNLATERGLLRSSGENVIQLAKLNSQSQHAAEHLQVHMLQLEEVVGRQKQEMERACITLEALGTVKQELLMEHKAQHKSVEQKEMQSHGLLAKNGELVAKVSSLEDEIRKVREAKDSEISQLLDRQQQLEKLSAGQAKEIEMRDGAIGDLEQQSAVLQQELCDKNEECSRLAALTDDLTAQKRLIDDLLKKTEDQQRQWEISDQEKEQRLLAEICERERLQLQYEQLSKSHERALQTHETTAVEVQSLKEQLQVATTQNQRAENSLDSKSEEHEATLQEFKMLLTQTQLYEEKTMMLEEALQKAELNLATERGLLRSSEENLTHLQKLNSQLQHAAEHLQVHMLQLEEVVGRQKQEMERACITLEALGTVKQELLMEHKAQHKSVEQKEMQSHGLLAKNGELVAKVSSLEDEIRKVREAKDSEISQLLDRQQQLEKLSAGQAKEIEMRDGAIGDLEQQSAVLQQELCDKNEECSRLAALTDDLTAQKRLIDDLLKKTEDQQRQWEISDQEKEQRLLVEICERERLQLQYEQLSKSHERALQTHETTAVEVQSLKEQLQVATTQNQRAENSLDSKSEEHEATLQEFKMLLTQTQLYEEKTMMLEEALQKAELNLAGSEGAVTQLQEENSRLQHAAEHLQVHMLQLEEVVGRQKQEMERACITLEALGTVKQELLMEHKAQHKSVEQKEMQSHGLLAKNGELVAKVSSLEDEIRKVREAKDSEISQLLDRQQQLEKLSAGQAKEIEMRDGAIGDLEQQSAVLQQELCDKNEECSRLAALTDDLTAQKRLIDDLLKKTEDQQRQWEISDQEKEQRLLVEICERERLQLQYEQLSKSHERALQTHETTAVEVQSLKEQLQVATTQNQRAENSLDSKSEEHEATLQEFKMLLTQTQLYEEKTMMLEEALQKAELNLAGSEGAVTQLQEENSQLQHAAEHLQVHMLQLEEVVGRQKQEMERACITLEALGTVKQELLMEHKAQHKSVEQKEMQSHGLLAKNGELVAKVSSLEDEIRKVREAKDSEISQLLDRQQQLEKLSAGQAKEIEMRDGAIGDLEQQSAVLQQELCDKNEECSRLAALTDDLTAQKRLIDDLLKKTEDQQRQWEISDQEKEQRLLAEICERERLQLQYEQLSKSHERALQTHETTAVEVQSLKEQLQVATTQNQRAENSLDSKSEEHEATLQEFKMLLTQTQLYEEKTMMLEEALQKAELNLAGSEGAVTQLQEENSQLQHAAEHLQVHMLQLEEVVGRQKQEMERACITLEALGTVKQELLMEHKAQHKSVEQKEMQSHGLLAKNGELVAKVSSLEDEIRKVREAKDSEISQLLDRQQQLEKLSAGQAKEIEMRDGAIGDLEQQSAVLQQELCDKNEECSRLAALTDDLTAQKPHEVGTMTALTATQQQLKPQVAGKQSQFSRNDDSIMELRQVKELVEQTVTAQEWDIADRESTIAAFTARHELLAQQIAEQQSELSWKECSITELRQVKESLEQSSADRDWDIADRDSTIGALEAQQQQLMRQVADQQSDISGKVCLISDLTAKLQEREQQVADQRSKLSSNITELTQEKHLLEQEVCVQEWYVAGRDNKIAALSAKQKQLRQKVADQHSDILGKASAITHLTAKQQHLEQRLAEKQSELSEKDRSIAELRQVKKSLERKLSAQERDIEDKDSRMAALEAAVPLLKLAAQSRGEGEESLNGRRQAKGLLEQELCAQKASSQEWCIALKGIAALRAQQKQLRQRLRDKEGTIADLTAQKQKLEQLFADRHSALSKRGRAGPKRVTVLTHATDLEQAASAQTTAQTSDCDDEYSGMRDLKAK